MEFPDREKLLRRITTRKLYCTIKFDNREIDVLFKDPPLELLAEADWIYNKYYNRNKANEDFITLEESFKILENDGKWSNNKENELNGLKRDVITLQDKLPSLKYQKKEARRVKKTIESAENRITELEKIKFSLYTLTLDHFCHQLRRRHIVKSISSFIGGDDFKPENTRLLDILAVYYFEEHSISMKDIRELARSDPWRLYWTASKDSNIQLFPHSAVEMSDWQYLLILWSRIYDYAFTSSSPPTDAIVNDDYEFDAWYKAQVSGQNAEQNGGSFSGNGMQEIFIMADEEGAKEVLELNNPMGLARVQSINKIVKEQGEVSEINLPDTQRNLKMAANQMTPPK